METKAFNILKKVAKERNIEFIGRVGEKEFFPGYNKAKKHIYIDGDIVSAYWGECAEGWEIRNDIDELMSRAGLYFEPYVNSILAVYKNN